MLNIYLIYVSSLETGNTEIFKNSYTSFNKALSEIDLMIDQYVIDRKAEKSFRVFLKEDFDIKKISRDISIPIDCYCFEKDKSTVNVYKKILIEGRFWNGAKLIRIAKIGILPEINIPVDSKLLRLINAVSEISEPFEIPDAPTFCDSYKTIKLTPSNLEHGKHVSFIHELKEKLELRNKKENISVILPNKVTNQPNEKHQKFINELNDMKGKLKSVSPSELLSETILRPKPRLIIVNNPINEDSDDDSDVTSKSLSDNDSDVSSESDISSDIVSESETEEISEISELSDDETSDWDETSEELLPAVPILTETVGKVTDEVIETEIDKMVNEIMETINKQMISIPNNKVWTVLSDGPITLDKEIEILNYCNEQSISYVRQTISPSGIIIRTSADKAYNLVEDIPWIKSIRVDDFSYYYQNEQSYQKYPNNDTYINIDENDWDIY